MTPRLPASWSAPPPSDGAGCFSVVDKDLPQLQKLGHNAQNFRCVFPRVIVFMRREQNGLFRWKKRGCIQFPCLRVQYPELMGATDMVVESVLSKGSFAVMSNNAFVFAGGFLSNVNFG